MGHLLLDLWLTMLNFVLCFTCEWSQGQWAKVQGQCYCELYVSQKGLKLWLQIQLKDTCLHAVCFLLKWSLMIVILANWYLGALSSFKGQLLCHDIIAHLELYVSSQRERLEIVFDFKNIGNKTSYFFILGLESKTTAHFCLPLLHSTGIPKVWTENSSSFFIKVPNIRLSAIYRSLFSMYYDRTLILECLLPLLIGKPLFIVPFFF